jgi:hypothetical protein
MAWESYLTVFIFRSLRSETLAARIGLAWWRHRQHLQQNCSAIHPGLACLAGERRPALGPRSADVLPEIPPLTAAAVNDVTPARTHAGNRANPLGVGTVAIVLRIGMTWRFLQN